mmetsp:Transcript_816/g.2657  ORF Transcript_816/g.2657 Transcript_816/m.2657 type:complete len:289 (-) Transcript_816:268-1134(-)
MAAALQPGARTPPGTYKAAAARTGAHGVVRVGGTPGFTRSIVARDHTLLCPESRVYSPMPGWEGAVGANLCSPANPGSLVSMTLVEMNQHGSSNAALKGVERCVVVLRGEVSVSNTTSVFRENEYFYCPPWEKSSFEALSNGATVLMYEQVYRPAKHLTDALPTFVSGGIDECKTLDPGPDECFVLRKLLPMDVEWDMNIHVMDFAPGQTLGVRELHYNQHALFMLEGGGVYRLGQDSWYPVTAGDAAYIAPWCMQWYGALGDTRTRYIISKDCNRDPLTTGSAGVTA